jgi:alpha-galactosidase
MQAAYSGRLEVAQLLLERGATVDSRTVRGLTPLMQAVGSGNKGVARLLLQHGADVNAVDSSAQTPAIWAKKRGHEELLPFLKQTGARIDGVIGDPVTMSITTDAPVNRWRMALPAPPNAPQIHGPRRIGASPRRPFLYRIPAEGKAPLRFSATGLPPGTTLDKATGIITGSISAPGTYKTSLTVTNAAGTATRAVTVVCGEKQIGLTPPLGWSAWNLFGDSVDAEKVRQQADWLVKSGLAAHGYSYILLDDSWQGRRDSKTGEMTANQRLGSIKALADYVHARGLKLGLYSSPNKETSGGYTGSEGHEAQDAKTFAAWGIDYLKYDWTDNTRGKFAVPAETVRDAFAKMRVALDGTDRDIFFALTPYGFGGVQPWGEAPVSANSWWINSQVIESWDNVSRNLANLVNGFAQPVKPGHWNDPGWLLVGKVGSATLNPHFTKLTVSEQQTQLTAWSLAAAPLILSCDLTQLDPNRLYPVTTALLVNDDVLEVNQDSLGQPAKRITVSGQTEVWARPLDDGTVAVGLFNKGDSDREVTVNFNDLPVPLSGNRLQGSQSVRDLWLRKNLGAASGVYKATVPRHGVTFIKIGAPKAL